MPVFLTVLLASLPPLPLLVLAGLAVFLAYKYFKWEAIRWFSVLLISSCGGALALDYIISVMVLGNARDYLGNARDYCNLGFVCGVFLFCASFYKRYKRGRTGPDPTTPRPEDRVDAKFIHRELMRQVGKVEKELDDPITVGRADATSPSGAIPDRAATAPPIGRFEEEAKSKFSERGTRFAKDIADRLRKSIRKALTRLRNIQKEVQNRPYRGMAEAEYRNIAPDVTSFQVQEIKNKFVETKIAEDEFIDTLKLGPAEPPDWPERTTRKGLWELGIILLLIEFMLNWYLSSDVLGVEGAIKIAIYAVILIPVLGGFFGVLLKHTRRNRPWLKRLFAGLGYVAFPAVALVGLGLLVTLRDPDAVATDATDGLSFWLSVWFFLSAWMEAIVRSFTNILTDLNNLLVFMVNVAALVAFCWKISTYFEKFCGYDAVHDPYVAAVNEYKSLFSQDAESATSAIGKIKEKSDANREEALQLCETITEETATLENLMQIIGADYPAVLHPAYHKAIKSYRDSNTKHRVVEINPPPPYFAKSAEFPAPESHLSYSEDIAKFLEEKREEISQSSAVRDEITGASLLWDRERRDLHKELTDKFKAAIDKMEGGRGARPIEREAETNE